MNAIKEHVARLGLAIEADLETGSHHLNNEAHERFSRQYKYLNEWLDELTALVEVSDVLAENESLRKQVTELQAKAEAYWDTVESVAIGEKLESPGDPSQYAR